MGTLTPLIAGNWKMNKLPSEAETWATNLKDALTHFDVEAEILICAPFTHLAGLRTVFTDSPVAVGSQDVSQHSEGAYTGEVSAAMLKDIGVTYAIIGHSERRDYHFERSPPDSLCRRKFGAT
jgi:triosephosphate isomerase (TIM)